MEQHGQAAPREILARMRGGAAFDRAFTEVTGVTPGEAESDFRQRQRIWTTWVPIITSSATLWIVVTLIALWAIRRRRQKDAALRKEWEEEESAETWIDN
jgi:heme/copper-type cytochrome/quinol oxidase subunit 2